MPRKAIILPVRAAVPLLLAMLLLGACGQKGPLYIEGHSKDTPWPMKPAGDGPEARKAPAPGSATGSPASAPPPAAAAPQGAR